MPGEGRRRDRIGALLVGVRDEDGRLRYAGRVGTGFTEDELDRLAALLAPLERDTSPFDAGRGRSRRAARSSSSRASWPRSSSASGPRAASCAPRPTRGCATTSPPDLVIAEDKAGARALVDGRELRLSNLDKVLYPAVGFTKRDVIDYYADVAPVLLPHLEGRPLTLKRYPNGVDAGHFYEKNAPSHRPPWVHTARVPTGSKSIDFVVVDDRATLVWLANLADLELHTSLARADDMRAPDDDGLRPRPGRAGDDRRVLPGRRCCCRACSTGSGCRASPRRRAPRACRSTCR